MYREDAFYTSGRDTREKLKRYLKEEERKNNY